MAIQRLPARSPRPAPRGRRPALGLVIGTHAALPYIHLQLEARRRFYPDVPTLVCDDASPHAAELAALCRAHGAEFFSHPERRGHVSGDLAVYAVGLAWAAARRVRFLHKVSRRWIWRTDWRADLLRLFTASGCPTVSNHTRAYGFGFRTECLAFDVAAWLRSNFLTDVQIRIDTRAWILVESYVHDWAGQVSHAASAKWRAWQAAHPRRADRGGYAAWPLMGTCRCTPAPNHLWHNANPPMDYAALAAAWGLPYRHRDFANPDAGPRRARTAAKISVGNR